MLRVTNREFKRIDLDDDVLDFENRAFVLVCRYEVNCSL